MNLKQKRKVNLSYTGSRFWVIFWAIIFFPVAVALLATGVRFQLDDVIHTIEYEGSRFWLCFWLILFFPIAFVLLLLNGFSIVTEPALLAGPGASAHPQIP